MCFDTDFSDAWASEDAAYCASVFCWVFNIKCRLHGGGNAIKRGSDQLHTPEILKDVHICLKSLISGSEALHKHIDQFIGTCLAFEDQTLTTPDIQAFWQTLHVDDDFLHELGLTLLSLLAICDCRRLD